LFGFNKTKQTEIVETKIGPQDYIPEVPKNVIDSQLISASWTQDNNKGFFSGLNIIENYDKVSENHEWLEML